MVVDGLVAGRVVMESEDVSSEFGAEILRVTAGRVNHHQVCDPFDIRLRALRNLFSSACMCALLVAHCIAHQRFMIPRLSFHQRSKLLVAVRLRLPKRHAEYTESMQTLNAVPK